MAVIDADGLFEGERFDLCSDEARMFWPHFWCASNAFGRFEFSYRKIVARAFHKWKIPPSEETFIRCMAEYQDAYLLFVYEDGGQLWAQWDTPKKYLPNYQTKLEKRSPEPDAEAFEAWRAEYQKQKNLRSKRQLSVKISEKFPKNSENFSEKFPNGIGVGNGNGIIGNGRGETFPAAEAAGAPSVRSAVESSAVLRQLPQLPHIPTEQRSPVPIDTGKKTIRGTRFTEDSIPDGWTEWCVTDLGWDVSRVNAVFLIFRDHWRSKTRDATKLDWLATWRNWCKEDIKRESRGRAGPLFAQKTSATERAIAVVHQRIEKGERPFG